MRRFAAFFLALVCAWGPLTHPAAAAAPSVNAVVLRGAGSCRGVALSVNFVTGAACYGGKSVPGYTSLPGWSFARASTKYCQTSGGALVQVVSGVPCITDQGLLFEESRTNLFLNSFTPTTQTISLGSTGSYSISVWGSGSAVVAAGTATITGAGTASAGTSVTINCTVTGTITVTISGAPTAVQVEAGAFGTSPIATTGSTATRAADSLTPLPLTIAGAGSVVATFQQSPVTSSSTRIWNLDNNRPGWTTNGWVNPVGSVSGNGQAAGPNRVGLSWGNNLFSAVQNGAIQNSGSATTTVATSLFAIGRATTAGSLQPDTYVKQVTVYPFQMSAAQLQAATQ